jgi:hypothetical protein
MSCSDRGLLIGLTALLFVLVSCGEGPTPELPPPVITVTPGAPDASPTPTPAPTDTTAPPSPAAADHPTLAPADPSPTPSPQPTATTVALGPFETCPVDEAAVVAPDGPARALIFNDLGAWRWDEATGVTSALGLPGGARSPVPSPDGDRVAYSLEPEEGAVQLWVMDADGGNRRQLAETSITGYLQSSPEYVVDAALSYYWLAGGQRIAHQITPVLGALGETPLETVTVADAESGATWVLVPGGEAHTLRYSFDGSQVAAFGEETVRLVDVGSGEVMHAVDLAVQSWRFSASYTPDGAMLVAFAAEEIALVDAATGEMRAIPFEYTPIGMGHVALMPPIHWLPDGRSFYTLVPEGDEANEILSEDASFTVWRVDTEAADAEPVQTFTGSVVSVQFSPDFQRLAFWTQRQDNVRTLYLADLASGEQVAYDRRRILEFLNWHPDAAQFVYWEFEEKTPLLGHLCRTSTALEAVNIPFAGAVYWLGSQRFISVEGQTSGDEVVEVRDPWEIHLHTVGGEDVLLQTVEGAAPRVQLDR